MRKLLATHSEFMGNVAVIMSGRTLSALIALFTMPVVARLFTPTDFGAAAVFVSICSIVSPMASLRYESAIVLPKQQSDAILLMALAYRIAFLVTCAMWAAIAVIEISGIQLTALQLLGDWRWALPIGILLMAVALIQENWCAREKRFRIVSTSLVVGNAVTSGTRIGIGAALGTSVYGLIIGYIIGLISRIAVMHESSRIGLQSCFRVLGKTKVWGIMRQYSDFPKLNAPAGLVFAAGQNLPVLVFGAVFSPAIAGLYAMANRLAQVPVAIVANSMRKVFLQRAADIVNEGRSLSRAFLLATSGLALLGVFPFLLIAFVGQEICTWLLGRDWTNAGGFLEIMAPWLFMAWVEAPCNPVFIVLRRQKFWLALQSTLTILRLAAFGVAYLLGSTPAETLRAFVIATVIGSAATIATAYYFISRPEQVRPGQRD